MLIRTATGGGLVVAVDHERPREIIVGAERLDENHAQALVLAVQAAIAEVQARAVELPPEARRQTTPRGTVGQ